MFLKLRDGAKLEALLSDVGVMWSQWDTFVADGVLNQLQKLQPRCGQKAHVMVRQEKALG